MRKTGEASVVKLTRPKLSGVAPRPRLFRLLDAGRKKPVIWIAGPAGAGKTTLAAGWLDSRKLPCLWYQVDGGDGDIASFFYYMGLAAKEAAPRHKHPLPLLTTEYLQGISAFTRRYFEELFRRLKAPLAVVFDNFQDAASPAFCEMIANALEAIPEGIYVVILSRYEPPAELSRLRANNKMMVVLWDDLSFTLTECRAFLKARGNGTMPEETIRRLHEKTEGWAAGLVLMTEMTKTNTVDYSMISELSREAVFGYFAAEIFDKTSEEIRDFLLKTSFLPSMSAEAAGELTGSPDAHSILSRLSRAHYFTEWRPLPKPVFQYHPLFREFLQSRAKSLFDHETLLDLYGRTGLILEKNGQADEAAALYIRLGEGEGLKRLVLSKAASLISQGRFRIVAGWLSNIPPDFLNSDPWLLYWEGVCNLLSGMLVDGRTCFEKAFSLFSEKADRAGALLSWSGVVESIIYTWDDFRPLDKWIDWLGEHEKEIHCHDSVPWAKAAACMAMALYFRRFSSPEIEPWIERAISSAQKTGDVNMQMQAYLNGVWYLLFTDVPRCRVMLDQAAKMVMLSGSPFMKVNLRGLQAVVHSSYPEWGEDAVGEILEALQLSGKEGISFYDPILLPQAAFAFLNRGETARLPELLEKIKHAVPPGMRNLQACYHMLVGWERLAAGDVGLAVAHARRALENSVESGSPVAEAISLVVLTQALHDAGDHEESLMQLAAVRRTACRTRNYLLQYLSLLMEALFAIDRKDGEYQHLLSEAMYLGKSKSLATLLFWWNRRGMSRLCSKAIEAGIEEDYVKTLIRTLRLVPELPADNWPYPVRVTTLGKFQVLVEDEPVTFPGKVQRKPLAMLQALIALGARDVPGRQLEDILWPDAEGDSAQKSFEMTLLRLRRLLGREEAVSLKGGLLSLNPGCCWLDADAFQSLARKAEEAWKNLPGPKTRSRAEAVGLSEKALAMYDGPFLAGDTELDCAIGPREKMRNLALQQVSFLGGHWEKAKQWRKAIACYRKGIEIDRLYEDFYRALMSCHAQLGQRAEAVRVYRSCQSALSSGLGIGPSEKTKEAYSKIRGKA